MENHLFISTCLLLAVAGSWSEATPVPSADADGPHDVRWRLVTGLEAAEEFSKGFAKQLRSCTREPLLNASEELQTILSGVCQQLEVQELTAKDQNENGLHVLLEQNILDSCHWLNYLVTEGEVSASARFLELNETCEVGNTPRLSQYCLEYRLASFYDKIYQPVSDYYSGIVVDLHVPTWLNSSLPTTNSVKRLETLLTSNQSTPCYF